jgi:flagellar motor protein MotB
MRRCSKLLLGALLLPLVLLAGCGAGSSQYVLCPNEVAVRDKLRDLTGEIDLLVKRYDTLLKQNQAIEKLLADLGFTLEMTTDTVQQRVDMMHRFERAETSRTATYQKLRGLLQTLASQHQVETYVEVRAGQIVVRIAERALFGPGGAVRAESAPLVWAVAEGLKELTGRGFEVAAEVAAPAVATPEPAVAAPGAAQAKAQAKAKPKARRPKGQAEPAPPSPHALAAARAAEVLRLLEGAGLPAARLAAVQRPPAAVGGAPFIEIVVLPMRDELPRVHGATDTAAPPPPRPAPAGPPPVAAPPASAPARR